MYLSIDVGGTKTLVACFDQDGKLLNQKRFLTPDKYLDFLRLIGPASLELMSGQFKAACVAFPGKIDREHGIGIVGGNLPWHNAHLVRDLHAILKCPIFVENDAKLAALSEARFIKDKYSKVLYVTISTGIGTGVVTNMRLDPSYLDLEGGHILLEHHGKRQLWESFSSGSAIVRRYGKRATEITDQKTWKLIARDIATGLIDLSITIEPDVIILGGSVSNAYDRFIHFLKEEFSKYETPLTPLPPIRKARHTDQAVVYGCLEYIKGHQ